MTSIVEVLSIQMDNPLPPGYIETIREAVISLVNGLQVALSQATLVFVIPQFLIAYMGLSLHYA